MGFEGTRRSSYANNPEQRATVFAGSGETSAANLRLVPPLGRTQRQNIRRHVPATQTRCPHCFWTEPCQRLTRAKADPRPSGYTRLHHSTQTSVFVSSWEIHGGRGRWSGTGSRSAHHGAWLEELLLLFSDTSINQSAAAFKPQTRVTIPPLNTLGPGGCGNRSEITRPQNSVG